MDIHFWNAIRVAVKEAEAKALARKAAQDAAEATLKQKTVDRMLAITLAEGKVQEARKRTRSHAEGSG